VDFKLRAEEKQRALAFTLGEGYEELNSPGSLNCLGPFMYRWAVTSTRRNLSPNSQKRNEGAYSLKVLRAKGAGSTLTPNLA